MLLRKIISRSIPGAVALAAFLHAHTIGSLVDATTAPAAIAPFAEARAAATTASGRRVAPPSLPQCEGDAESAELRVVYVAEDRVWLERDGALCQALLPELRAVRPTRTRHHG